MRRRRMITVPAIRTPAATATGQRRCMAGLCRNRSDISAARSCARAFSSAARARALVSRLEQDAASDEARIGLAYRLLYSRPATSEELQLGLQFLTAPAPADDQQLSAWQQYAQVLLSANELMYLE